MNAETAHSCRIELFGPIRLLQQDCITTRFRVQKASTLLAYLALNLHRPHTRERLADLLWPELGMEASRNKLSAALSWLRKVLEPAGSTAGSVLATDRHMISLRQKQVCTDVVEFDSLLARARSAAIVADRARLLAAAIGLYRGDLLEGCDDEWAQTARTAYWERYCEALLDWAQDLETERKWGEARLAAQRVMLADPLSEEATLVLMRVQARQGRAADAVETYDRFRQRLYDELGAVPAPELRRLMERLRHDPDALYTPRPADTTDESTDSGTAQSSTLESPTVESLQLESLPLQSTAGRCGETEAGDEEGTSANHLPIALTSFVGREQELAEIQRLLAQTRLLTLTGIGGCGKTRTAIQIGHLAQDLYPDGVWLVELAALSDPALVATTVAQMLEVKERSGQAMMDTLIASLKRRRLLLILDNCEHLIEACAQLTTLLLRFCPYVKVLATSREAVVITGEQTYRLPSLSLPAPQTTVSLETLQRYSATRLFIERAALAKSNFTVTPQNAPLIIEICKRLDGVPLAIEMAASRVKSLSVEELNQRLDDRFGLLIGGDRTALPRHQTLRALMDWSYELLTEDERQLLARLAVFAGGWTLAAAEKVAGISSLMIGASDYQSLPADHRQPLASDVFLDILTPLVDKSLVVADARDGTMRYRMLETVRQYAQEKLVASGTATRFKTAHRDYYQALAAEAEPQLTGPEQRRWLELLETEHDNLRAALTWCTDQPDGVEGGLRLCAALQQFWWTHGHFAEGRAWCTRLLSKEGGQEYRAERASVLNAAGLMAYSQNDYAAARCYHEASLAIHREIGGQLGLASSLNYLGNVATDQGDHGAARRYYQEALVIRRECGDQRGIAIALGNLGTVARSLGEHASSRAYFAESLTIRREISDWSGTANMLNRLGDTAFVEGDYARARTFYEESLGICREIGYRAGLASTLMSQGYVSRYQGDIIAARTLSQESLLLFRELGDRRGIAGTLDNLSNLAIDEGDTVAARALCKESLDIYQEIGYCMGIAGALITLGGIAFAESDYKSAQSLYEEGLRLNFELGNKRGVARTLAKIGVTAAVQSDSARAARLWGAAVTLRQTIGVPFPPDQQERYERHIAKARAGLGEVAFSAAQQEGGTIAFEDLLAYACADFAVGGTDLRAIMKRALL